MSEKKSVQALVVGGQANAGPPLGPALGPLGVNVINVVNEINKVTGDYNGMRVPVKVLVDTETKAFEVEVGLPTTSALIAKEAKVAKGAGNPATEFVGELNKENIVKIAEVKIQQSYATTIKSAVKEVLGSCVSFGVKIEGSNPRDVIKEVDGGKWDDLFSKKK